MLRFVLAIFTVITMTWTIPEKVRMVELYHQTGSATQARRTFMRERNLRRGPSTVRVSIMRLVEQFRHTGSLVRRGGGSGPSSITKPFFEPLSCPSAGCHSEQEIVGSS